MKILTLLLTLIFAVSASKDWPESLGDSVVKKHLDIVFSGSISYQYMLGVGYSDSDDSDSIGAMNSDQRTNSARSTNSHEKTNSYEDLDWADYPCSSDLGTSEETGSNDAEGEMLFTLPKFIQDIQKAQDHSLSLDVRDSAKTVKSHEKTNSYEDLDWADYPCSSDSDTSEETGNNDAEGEMLFTLPKFIQDIQKAQDHSLSLDVRDSAKTVKSHEKTNSYEDLDWADYPCSSDSGTSEEIGSNDAEGVVITPTSIPDVERRDSDSQGFGGLSAWKVISGDREISSVCSTATSIQEDRPDFQRLRMEYSAEVRAGHEETNSSLTIPFEYSELSDSYSNKAVYSSEHSEIDNTPVSDEPIALSEDWVDLSKYSGNYDILAPDKYLALSVDQVNYSITQHTVYNRLFNIIYRMNETILAYPEYFLTNKDKILLENLESDYNSAMIDKTQILRNVIDGIAISCEEVKSLRGIIDNKSVDIEIRLALKNIFKRREFNNYERKILSVIKSLNPKQRKFLLSLIEAATDDVIAIPFNSGRIFDIPNTVKNQRTTDVDTNYNTSNIKEGFLFINSRGDTSVDLKRELDKRSPAYNTVDDLLTVNGVEKHKIFLSYNNYCWINNQLFPKGLFNQELVKALCEVDKITDSDMLFAKFVRRLIKGFDLRKAIRLICEGHNTHGEGLNIHYDEQESTLTPMKDVYTKLEVFASIQSMLSKHAEVIAKYSTDYAENLNQFQNYILHVMRSGQIIQYISDHNMLRLHSCKLTEGLGEDDIRITVMACQDIVRVISSEVKVSSFTGLYQVMPDSVIARFVADVWDNVICAFKM